MKTSPDWIALDWGTSNLRVWAMTSSGAILDAAKSDQGMATLSPADFEPTLLTLIAPWLRDDHKTPVLGCGMVGAKQGWLEAPYLEAPCSPVTPTIHIPTQDPRIAVQVRSGVKQLSPPDVMRGEETQIAGLLATEPDFQGVICLPGTHSKWVQITDGHIQQFQTFMTGELFALLAEKSVLRHTVTTEHADETSFLTAFGEALENPSHFSATLFSLRAGALIADLIPAAGRARLSGLLIGLEFAGARPFWENQPEIVIIGTENVAQNYQLALSALSIRTQSLPADEMTLAGLQSSR